MKYNAKRSIRMREKYKAKKEMRKKASFLVSLSSNEIKSHSFLKLKFVF